MNSLYPSLEKFAYAASGVALHHYGSKLLDYRDNKTEELVQGERDEKMNTLCENMEHVKNKTDNFSKFVDMFSEKGNVLIPKETANRFDALIKKGTDEASRVVDSMDECAKVPKKEWSKAHETLNQDAQDFVSTFGDLKKL